MKLPDSPLKDHIMWHRCEGSWWPLVDLRFANSYEAAWKHGGRAKLAVWQEARR